MLSLLNVDDLPLEKELVTAYSSRHTNVKSKLDIVTNMHLRVQLPNCSLQLHVTCLDQ